MRENETEAEIGDDIDNQYLSGEEDRGSAGSWTGELSAESKTLNPNSSFFRRMKTRRFREVWMSHANRLNHAEACGKKGKNN